MPLTLVYLPVKLLRIYVFLCVRVVCACILRAVISDTGWPFLSYGTLFLLVLLLCFINLLCSVK